MNERDATAIYTSSFHTYGIINRPLSPYTAPSGWIPNSHKLTHPNFKKFGTIAYPQLLSDELVAKYELRFLSSIIIESDWHDFASQAEKIWISDDYFLLTKTETSYKLLRAEACAGYWIITALKEFL